jgi:hypothetical protein
MKTLYLFRYIELETKEPAIWGCLAYSENEAKETFQHCHDRARALTRLGTPILINLSQNEPDERKTKKVLTNIINDDNAYYTYRKE